MNNILTFEDYKKMNIRQVESVIYRQFIEEDIKDEEIVNEGIIRNAINKASGKFIQTALADEIEKGKELEKSIKEALDGLNKGFDEIEKSINSDDDKKSKSKLAAIEKVKEAIKAVQSQAFDTLTMIGSEGEIDFAGFLGSSTVAAAANFGILFSPIRSLFVTRKAYKYFLGIIKQTIRRNLLIIQLNFDQFENLILQKSFETDEDSEFITKIETMNSVLTSMTEQLCGEKTKFLKGSKNKDLKDKIEVIRKNMSDEYKRHKENAKRSPYGSLFNDQYNNTYTKTLEQIKQYINEDSQKELDSLKNSITKMAGNDVELVQYGELIISAAEEYAIHTNHGINNNFIKMSSVFNLENQKKLIELIVDAQKENLSEIQRKKDEQDLKDSKEKLEKRIKDGKKLYEEKLKDSEKTYTLDEFEEEFEDDDIQSLRAFFNSEEGADAYKELIDKHPSYKYFIMNEETLNSLLSAINDLKVVNINDRDEYYSKLAKREQALYYTMAERSIKDAVKSVDSEEFFGFKSINYTEDVKPSDNTLIDDVVNGKNERNDRPIIQSIKNEIFTKKHRRNGGKGYHDVPRYFLTFDGEGNGLFNILHNDFKTEFFENDKEYVKPISLKSKESIMKLIFKQLKIGKNIMSQFSEYLVRLDAHMLLEEKKPWFVAKDNTVLIPCFNKEQDLDKIVNRNAFVEVEEEDFEGIQKFLSRLHELSNSDFNINDSEKSGEKTEK